MLFLREDLKYLRQDVMWDCNDIETSVQYIDIRHVYTNMIKHETLGGDGAGGTRSISVGGFSKKCVWNVTIYSASF